jgi:glycosyltransferase involved in cell wall biosynthesis
MKTISIVIPVYQNEENIPDLIKSLQELEKRGNACHFEFLFVNDGSTDNSLPLLRKIVSDQQLKNVKIVCLTKNFGQIPAIYAGLKQSTGELKAIISADLQDDPHFILEMFNQIDEEHPLVIAERANRNDSLLNKFFSWFFYYSMRKVVNPNYPTGGYDYCLFTQSVCDEILKFEQKNAHLFVIILWLGFKFKSIKYVRQKRKHGKSQWTFQMKLKLYLDTMIGFSSLPIRIISIIGASIAFIGFAIATYNLFYYLINGNPITGWTSLIISILIMGGLILITLGILGEYIWRSFDAARKRQIFVIDKIISND